MTIMQTVEALNSRSKGKFPSLLGIEILEATEGFVRSRLDIRPELLAPNGYLHAATVVGIADTSCGYGCIASLPQGATSFTTVELKTNFLGTARDGRLECEAHMQHGGRTTQVWDATVRDANSGKTIALFRCTQMLLYN